VRKYLMNSSGVSKVSVIPASKRDKRLLHAGMTWFFLSKPQVIY